MILIYLKLAKWLAYSIVLLIIAYFLLFGFVTGLYCSRYNHGGAVDKDEIPRWIVWGLYPSYKIPWIRNYNAGCAQLVNINGRRQVEGLIFTFYFA
jgi:hypothetical protein